MPLLVLVDSAMVGFWLVLQHTPRAVMLPPPSEVMLPPLVAVELLIAETVVVLRVGNTTAAVLKLIWLPYAVPAAFVA